jgi:acyl carrier protein
LVMDVNWQQFAAGATRDQRAMFADLTRTASADRAVEPPHAAPPADVRREPVRGLRVARTEGITAMVCERARAILQLPDHAAVDREVPLADLGFDSLMSLELRDALSAALGIALPATLLFDHPSVGELVPFLLAQTEAQQGREHVGVEGATPRTDEHRAGAL